MFSITGGNASTTYPVFVAGDMLVKMPLCLGCGRRNTKIISNTSCGRNQSYTDKSTKKVSVYDGMKLEFCN